MSPHLELSCYLWHYQSTDSPSSLPSFLPISPSRPQQKGIFYLDKESACDAVAGTSSSRSTGSSRQWWQQWPQRESQLKRFQQWSSDCRAQTKINYVHATESATETDTNDSSTRQGWMNSQKSSHFYCPPSTVHHLWVQLKNNGKKLSNIANIF